MIHAVYSMPRVQCLGDGGGAPEKAAINPHVDNGGELIGSRGVDSIRHCSSRDAIFVQ